LEIRNRAAGRGKAHRLSHGQFVVARSPDRVTGPTEGLPLRELPVAAIALLLSPWDDVIAMSIRASPFGVFRVLRGLLYVSRSIDVAQSAFLGGIRHTGKV
jgi:hypothetical protein